MRIVSSTVTFLGAILVAGASVIAALWFTATSVPLSSYAAAIVTHCAASADRPSCYDREIPKLLDTLSMEETFKVTAIIQEQDSSYWFCHALGHKLSAAEYQKDPSKWLDIVGRCPVGMCSNGCIHGSIQERFSSEYVPPDKLHDLIPALSSLCERREGWDPTPQEQSSCYHEIGHLSLFLTGSDVRAAQEKICNAVAVKADGRNYLQTCQEGVFMQVFEPREPDDFAIVHPLVPDQKAIAHCEQYPPGVEKGACWKDGWKGHVSTFCDQYSGDVRNACYREAWVVDSDGIRNSSGILSYCSYAPDRSERTKCFNKLFYSLMSMTNFDYQYVESVCETFSDHTIMGQCYANTASRLVETDFRLTEKAAGVCRDAESKGVADVCWEELRHYANFSFPPESREQLAFCAMLPVPFQNGCGTIR